MNLKQYEDKFLEELIDNWNGTHWDDYVRACYTEYMHSVNEAVIANWENSP